MPSLMSIIKRDGTATPPMAQARVEVYLVQPDLISSGSGLVANLKQSLNQAFNGQGKASGSLTFNTQPVLHASSGNGQKSVTLFYYELGGILHLIGIGEHVNGNSYRMSVYGQTTGNFQEGKVVRL